MAQLPLDQTFALSIWLEVLLYGLYVGLFSTSVFVIVEKRNFRSVPSRIMFGTMLVMFFLATVHVALNLYRLMNGYVWLRDAPGGPIAYFGNLAKWDHVFKDTIYATQSIIGDSFSIYRCWLVWDNNYYVIALPLVLLACSTFSGYITCWLFTTVSDASIFSSRLQRWIATFYSIALAQNIMTTSLIAYHIWRRDRAASFLNTGTRSSLFPVVRIVIESAAIYVVAELVLVILYAINHNAQYIVLETITPIVGLVFTSITVRVSLRTSKRLNTSTGAGSASASLSMPMQPMTVRITRTHHDDKDHMAAHMEEGSNTDRHLFPENK